MKRALLLLGSGLFATSVWSANLMQIYRAALANDAQFAAARAQRDADAEKREQGLAGILPSVGLSASSTFSDFEVESPAAELKRRGNSNAYTIQLTQPLFRWQNWVQYRQGELQSVLGEVRIGQARQDLALRVAQSYFDVLNAQDALSAVVALREAAAQQRELAEKSFEVGTVTITDVHEAQSRYDLAQAQEIAARNDLDVRREALALIVGQAPEPLAGLRAGVTLERPEPDLMAEWVNAAEQHAYGVQAQRLALEIAEREVERARAAHLPTVDAVATHGHSSSLVNGVRYDGPTVGVQINLPLYAGGGIASRAREAFALKDRALAELETARRSAGLAARQAYLGVTNGMAQVKALEAAKVSSSSALEANKLGYEVGVRINIDVLNAQTQLADTLQKLAKARYDTLVAQLRLKAASGSLGDDDIERINGLLAR